MTMVERQKTMIEKAGGDLEVLDEMVREAVGDEVRGNHVHEAKIINRATHPRYLKAEATPNQEDTGVFISAIFQRYIEAADAESKYKRNKMIAAAALALDILKGDDYSDQSGHIKDQYTPHVPHLKRKGLFEGWRIMIGDSARMIRDDLGMEVASYTKGRAKEGISEEYATYDLNTTEDFTDLRSTVIDLIFNKNAPDMSKDRAAALLVALGVEKPRQGVSSEKLDTYRAHALQWLGRKLSHVNHDVYEDEVTRQEIEHGRQDLAEVAKKYPTKGDLTAPEWIVWRATGKVDRNYAKHVENRMAIALQELLIEE